MKEVLRVTAVLTLGGVVGAFGLAFLLVLLANLDSGHPWFTDLSVPRLFSMSVAFCLFTIPIAWSFGAPLYLLFRRFHLLRGWVGGVAGGVLGLAIPYSFRLLGFQMGLSWYAIFWFATSGVAAGAAIGFLLRSSEPPSRGAVAQSAANGP